MVMTRTSVGQALVDAAAAEGSLALTEEVFHPEESLGLQRKRHRYASFAEKHAGQVPHRRFTASSCNDRSTTTSHRLHEPLMTSATMSGRLSTRVFGPPAEPVDQICVGAPYSGSGAKTVSVHADKAISQRATILGAVADGESVIQNLADCHDVRRNLDALAALGVSIRPVGEAAVAVTGRHPQEWRSTEPWLDVGNSATTSRLLIGVLAGSAADYVVTGNELLRLRPMAEVIDPLRKLGANLTMLGAPGKLPIQIEGTSLDGRRGPGDRRLGPAGLGPALCRPACHRPGHDSSQDSSTRPHRTAPALDWCAGHGDSR